METRRLLVQLTDADEDVRGEAIHELCVRMNDEIARAFLDVASSDAGEEIRADAVIGLGPVIEEAGVDYFDDDADFELDPDVDSDLGPPITRTMFETIVSEARGLYDDESQPKLVRRRAFEVLIRDPQPWQAAEVRRLFTSDDPEWKLTAVFAMGHVNGFDKEIAALVHSGDARLRIEAVQAAGRMHVSAAASRIRDLAVSNETEKPLRLFAIEALPHVDRDSFEVLDRLTGSNDEEVVEAAEAALEELGLAESLDDEDLEDDELEDDGEVDFEEEEEEDER